MVAQQSKVFTENGFSVLQIDLYGCGDSSGDFKNASWEIWKRDVFHAVNWIKHHGPTPIKLWGLRLGCLLALDFVIDTQEPLHEIVLWNPLINGGAFLTQFLRLKVAMKSCKNRIMVHNIFISQHFQLFSSRRHGFVQDGL